MEQITKIKELLRGRKTYGVVAMGLLYLLGCWVGWWEFDEKILAAFGLGSLAFLRSAFKGAELPLLMAGAVALSMSMGCRTTNVEGRALVSVAITVDHAMRGWATYVAAGQASAKDEEQVKGAYERYQLAMKAAQEAYIAYEGTKDASGWERASVAMKAAQQDLLTLIESFGAAGK